MSADVRSFPRLAHTSTSARVPASPLLQRLMRKLAQLEQIKPGLVDEMEIVTDKMLERLRA